MFQYIGSNTRSFPKKNKYLFMQEIFNNLSMVLNILFISLLLSNFLTQVTLFLSSVTVYLTKKSLFNVLIIYLSLMHIFIKMLTIVSFYFIFIHKEKK